MSDWNGSANPNMDARLEGSPVFTAPANSVSSHYVNFSFACDFNGVEFYAWSPSIGDNLTLSTEYYVQPLDTWKRYKKFGKTFNVYPDNVTRVILFPTKPSVGVRIRIDYDNKGNSEVKFSLNKFQFVDMEIVDPSQLQEGEDW